MITPAMGARHLARMLREPIRVKLYQGMPNEFAMSEIVGGGYRDVVLTFRDWQIFSNAATPYAEAAAPISFRFDGTKQLDVAGAYMVNDNDGGLLWIQPFADAPFRIGRTGDTIPVLPRYALSSLGDTTGVGA